MRINGMRPANTRTGWKNSRSRRRAEAFRPFDRPLKRRRGFIEVSPLLLNESQSPVRRREMRIRFDRVIALVECPFKVPPVIVNHGPIPRYNRRNRIQRLGCLDFFHRFVQLSERRKTRHGVPVVTGRIPGIEAGRALKLPLSANPVPILRGFHMSKRGMRLG